MRFFAGCQQTFSIFYARREEGKRNFVIYFHCHLLPGLIYVPSKIEWHISALAAI